MKLWRAKLKYANHFINHGDLVREWSVSVGTLNPEGRLWPWMFFSALKWMCIAMAPNVVFFPQYIPLYISSLSLIVSTSQLTLLLLSSILFHRVCTKQSVSGTIRPCSWWDHLYYCLQHCPLSPQQQHCSTRTSRNQQLWMELSVCLVYVKHDHKQITAFQCRVCSCSRRGEWWRPYRCLHSIQIRLCLDANGRTRNRYASCGED